MAIPYTFVGPGNFTPGVGRAAFLGLVGAQNTATQIALDHTSAGGSAVQSLISAMDDSTSVIKGYLRLARPSDPSKFLVFAVTGQADFGYYSILFGTVINSGGNSNPFAASDSVGASFTPTGDKGDSGETHLSVSDRRASGTGGGSVVAGLQVRALNTTDVNTIVGASLAANTVTLPAGTYVVWGRAPILRGNGHQVQLWNTTDATLVVAGANAYASSAGDSQTDSALRHKFTIGAAKNFQLKHFVQSAYAANGLGSSITPGAASSECYAELHFTRLP